MSDLSILIIEDDEDFRASVAALVEREGYQTREAGSLAHARELLSEEAPDVVLLDLVLPDGDGLELLADTDLAAQTEFVVMTGHAAMESAVAALREGALDYLAKPVDRSRLQTILTNVARTRGLKRELSDLRGELRDLGRFGSMVGRSKAMQQVYDLITRVAPTESTVFVTGESGTGKELVAETVHQLSRRKDAPFIALNCGAMSATLIESELFGHEKGSFTGADRQHKGYFEQADGGTLFLDEISEMPVGLQVKLLRVLETGKVLRVGSSEPVPVDVRVLAASNRSPEEALAEGKLREDLFYRLNVFPITLPPLRARSGDAVLLARDFLERLNRDEGVEKQWSSEALDRIASLPWTGNVRELKNAVQRAWILAEEEIGPDAVPGGAAPEAEPGKGPLLHVRLGSSIAQVERRLILATLEHCDGDKKEAAEILGISLKTLYNRLNVYKSE